MREMYQNEAELSPTSPDYNVESLTGGDPFYDRFPWFRMVGRSFIYLSNLLYPVPLVHKVAIVNERGDVRGYLRIAVQPVLDEESIDFNNGVKQSARLVFNEDDAKPKYRALNEKDDVQRYIDNGGLDNKLEGMWIPLEILGNSLTKFPFLFIFRIGRCWLWTWHWLELGLGVRWECRGTRGASAGGQGVYLPCDCAAGHRHRRRICRHILSVQVSLKWGIDSVESLKFVYSFICSFLHRHEEAFSTEPVKNSASGAPLGFYHVQNVRWVLTLKESSIKLSFLFQTDYCARYKVLYWVLEDTTDHVQDLWALSDSSIAQGCQAGVRFSSTTKTHVATKHTH